MSKEIMCCIALIVQNISRPLIPQEYFVRMHLQNPWILAYLGAPDSVSHDQEVQSAYTKFQLMAAEEGIRCRPIDF